MSKYVKALRQTLKDRCYTPYLDDYSFMTMWKARFDFRILGLFRVPLPLKSQGSQPHHMLPPFFFYPQLRSAPQGGPCIHGEACQHSHSISFLILYKQPFVHLSRLGYTYTKTHLGKADPDERTIWALESDSGLPGHQLPGCQELSEWSKGCAFLHHVPLIPQGVVWLGEVQTEAL